MQRAGRADILSGRARYTVRAVASLLGAVILGWASGNAAAAPDNSAKVNLAQAMKRTLLLFPVDVPTTVGNRDDVQMLLTDTAISRLLASGQYTVVQFHKTLPPVARLHLDQTLTDNDIAEPYAEDNVKAMKITKAVGYDLTFVASVDEYNYNQADNVADMVISGRLVDVKTGKAVGTPVTLKAASSKGGTAKEPAKAMEAAREAGSQLMMKLVPITNVPIPVPTNPITNKPAPEAGKKKRNNNGLLLGLLAIGLGLGIGLASNGGHGGGGGAGGSSDGPPPPP